MPRRAFVWETMCARAACVQRANEQRAAEWIWCIFFFCCCCCSAVGRNSGRYKELVLQAFCCSQPHVCFEFPARFRWTSSNVGADFFFFVFVFFSEISRKGNKQTKQILKYGRDAVLQSLTDCTWLHVALKNAVASSHAALPLHLYHISLLCSCCVHHFVA